MNVPKEMRETYEKISKLLIEYSEKYLNKEYEELCLHALEKLCRKRPSPINDPAASCGVLREVAPLHIVEYAILLCLRFFFI